MRWRELTEARTAPLYHMMQIEKWDYCSEQNTMPARWEHKIEGIGRVKGNSFTRNPRFLYGDRPIRLVMDQQALAARFKIVPLDGEKTFRDTLNYDGGRTPDRVMNSRRLGDDATLSEEFVLGDIAPLNRYLVAVEVMGEDAGWLTPNESVELLASVTAYCEQYGVEARIHPAFIEKVAGIKKRWADEEAEENDSYT